jgi:hypothetical protein
MTHYGIIVDDEYNATHKRKRLTLWSGPFASVLEGEALSLPKGDGYMVTTYNGEKIRVEAPVERTSENYEEQDRAFNEALNKHRLEQIRVEIEAERISYGEIAELESLVDYIDPADTLLLQWANVEEFPEDVEVSNAIDELVAESKSVRFAKPVAAYVPNGKSVIRKR